MNTAAQKRNKHNLQLTRSCATKKTFRPVRSMWHQSLPSTQTNGCPQTWMLQGFVGGRPFVRVGGEVPMPQTPKSTMRGRKVLIVGLSFL